MTKSWGRWKNYFPLLLPLRKTLLLTCNFVLLLISSLYRCVDRFCLASLLYCYSYFRHSHLLLIHVFLQMLLFTTEQRFGRKQAPLAFKDDDRWRSGLFNDNAKTSGWLIKVLNTPSALTLYPDYVLFKCQNRDWTPLNTHAVYLFTELYVLLHKGRF